MAFKIPNPPKKNDLRMGADSKIPLNGGLCLKYEESALSDRQSPKMVNMNADDRGSLIKRLGLTYLFTSLGVGQINGIYDGTYKGNLVFHWGTNLYTQSGNNQPVSIYAGLTNSKSFLFVYNSILYILDGTNYVQYDGSTVKAVVPYIPTLLNYCTPDLGTQTTNESWNLLGSGFSVAYNGDGTAKVFTLPYKNLDATAMVVKVNGVTMVETTDYVIDRTAGTVTFTTAPSASGNLNKNNVVITAYKAQTGLPQQILGCTKAIECYSVMWFTGNANLPNYYFAGGTTSQTDASYFPQKRFYTLKGSDKAITGFALHYGELIVFKEDLIARITSTTDPNSNTSYPVSFINNKIGCDMPDTIQIANNDIVFANTYGGVFILQNKLYGYTDDKTVQPIGGNISGTVERPGLLQMQSSDLKQASSYVFQNKYYLCVTNVCYVWDFDISFYQQDNTDQSQYNLTWWYYTNINARQFFTAGMTLYFTDRTNGVISYFVNVPNDYGLAILASWRSKLMDFGLPDWEKTVNYIWLTTRANSSSAITINYYDDKETLIESIQIPASTTKSFSWDNFSWDNFTWDVQRFAPTIKDMPKLKKIIYFQVELSNSNYNENLSIISLVIQWLKNKVVR